MSRVAFYVAAAIFVLFAIVQLNDHDAAIWFAFYAAAAAIMVACGMSHAGIAAPVALVAIGVGLAAIDIHNLNGSPFQAAYFAKWDMVGGDEERARELGGVAIVGVAMALALVKEARHRRASASPARRPRDARPTSS